MDMTIMTKRLNQDWFRFRYAASSVYIECGATAGAINSSPVINVPEVAILGVHKIVDRPVVKDGQIVIRPMMNAAIGFDHRVVDGELAVKFLRRWCELIERPELLWFHV